MSTKKTIIYIGNFELPDKNAAAQRVIAVGKILRDLGYNVVYLGTNRDLEEHSNIHDSFTKYFEFDSWETPNPKNRKEWSHKIITPIGLETVISQYPADSLFAVIPYNYPAVAQHKIKSICSKHNAYYIPDITEWYESTGRRVVAGTVKWIDTFLRMRVFNFKADALITTSPYLTKFYKNKVMNIIELPTLYDSKTLKEIPQLHINQNSSTIKLLYAGSPFGSNTTYKSRSSVKDRLDIIIELLCDVKIKEIDFVLNIYGVTKKKYLEVYPEHKLLLLELHKKTFFHGRRPHKEIISSIKNSHFTIFFRDVVRLTESGFPSKLSESITAGTPVITNMISNLEPYLSNEKNIYNIDLNDENKKVNQMKALLSLSIDEIEIKKQECLESKTFDYRSYIHPMKNFLLGLKGTTNESE